MDVVEFRDGPDLKQRLVCPEEMGGCGALCEDEDGDGNDWVCHDGCGGEWNVHDLRDTVGEDLMELEE